MKTTAFFVFSIFLFYTSLVYAQKSTSDLSQTISHSDSVRLETYIDSLNTTTLYSLKRQRYYDSMLSICPWRAGWWQQKAMPLFKQKKYELGMPCLDSAVKYDAEKYLDYRAFMKCIFQKNYRGAIIDFQLCKQVIGDGAVMDHTYDFYIGLCYLQLNELDSAQRYIKKTVDKYEESGGKSWVHFLDLFYLGIVYYERENYTEAVKMMNMAIEKYQNFSDAKYYKAIALKRQHHDQEALQSMKDAYNDFNQGYSFTEDNALYEAYPYQITKRLYYTILLEDMEIKK